MKGKLVSFVISEALRAKPGKEELHIQSKRSAPHYFGETIPHQFIVSQEKISIRNHQGEVFLKTYKPDMLLVEIRFDVDDIFSDEIFDLNDDAIKYCYNFLKEKGGKDVDKFAEEYSVYIVYGYEGDPEQFFINKSKIVALLKSERIELDPEEVDYTMRAQMKYANNDLAIVDWDGAFIFEPNGEFEFTLELLQIANLQLVRYHSLDSDIDERLKHVVRLIKAAPAKSKFLFNAAEVAQVFKKAMLVRSESISEFQAVDREIKLIGDWYSARLFDLVSKKFKLDEWRKTIKEKLDDLEDIYSVASENFTVSWERRGHTIEMIGWYILLVGWMVFLLKDLFALVFGK